MALELRRIPFVSHLVGTYSPYPNNVIYNRAYFNESPVEVVKEQDKEINKLATDAIIPSMPGHVVQAFTLLKSSPEAQVCNCIILSMFFVHLIQMLQ